MFWSLYTFLLKKINLSCSRSCKIFIHKKSTSYERSLKNHLYKTLNNFKNVTFRGQLNLVINGL